MNVVYDKYNNVHKLIILCKSLKTEVIIKICNGPVVLTLGRYQNMIDKFMRICADMERSSVNYECPQAQIDSCLIDSSLI